MKILVTGATGFIGSHIVEELAKQGLAIRAAHRPGENLQTIDSDFLIDGLDLDSFALDITDRKAVHQALQGCQILFHADYLFSFDSRDKNRLYQINQLGTRNLMEAALKHGVEKVLYTSGLETLSPVPPPGLATERDGVSLDDLSTPYEKSRFLAEREVLNFKQKGLPAILLHPTVCLGKREEFSTPFGRYLRRFLQKKTHFYLDTGLNFVDVGDVAKGHLLAAKRGKVGARYILGNQNVYMLEILRKLTELSGQKAPKTGLPFGLAKLGNLFLRGVLRRSSGIPNTLIKRLQNPLFFDSSLARQELGFPQSNVWEALLSQIQSSQKNLGLP